MQDGSQVLPGLLLTFQWRFVMSVWDLKAMVWISLTPLLENLCQANMLVVCRAAGALLHASLHLVMTD
jgi:hypothetical protein